MHAQVQPLQQDNKSVAATGPQPGAHLSLTTGSSTSGPSCRSTLAPPKRISPAATSDTSGLSHSENMGVSSRPRSSMRQKPGRPPEALDRLGRARPCDARPRLSAEAAERAACGHCAADAAPAAADAHLATWRRWRCCAACAYMGCERQGRTKMPSQEAASKSGDAWLARPNVCAGSSSGGCASVSVSCASLPLTVPVPYFMVNAAAAPCKGRRNRGQAGVSGWRSDPRCTPPHPRPHRLPRQAHLLEGAAGAARKARMRTARRRLAVVGRQPAHVHYA